MKGIYKITNNITHKVYIGQTTDSNRRWKDHKRLAFTPNHKEYNKALYQAMRKYGIENFSFNLIEEIENKNERNNREIYWINYYNSYNNGYNESLGGDGGSQKGHCLGSQNGRARLSEEDVIKIRTYYKSGMAKSTAFQEFKDKISESGFSRVWRGETWKNIMPEVFTEENKQINIHLGKGLGAKHSRIFSDDEVRFIRNLKKNGETIPSIHQRFQDRASFATIRDICYNITYKEVK